MCTVCAYFMFEDVFSNSILRVRISVKFILHLVIALMIMKFGTGIKLDAFYAIVTRKFVTSLLLRNYDVITCILA